MTFDRKRFSVRSTPVACAVASVLAVAAAMPAVAQEGLEEIVVTAQRRETSLQTTPIAISAYAGDKLEEDKIFIGRRPREHRTSVFAHCGHAARP